MKLFITRRATRNIRAIGAFIRVDNSTAALEVEQAIRAACLVIAEHPEIGRLIEHDLRRFPVPRLPYLIYYSVDAPKGGRVEILLVNHAAHRRQPL